MSISTGNKANLNTLGGRLRAVREALGLKLGATAAQMKLSRTSLNQWEADKVENPDKVKLGKFCSLTDINLDWILERRGDDPDFLTKARKDVPIGMPFLSMEPPSRAELRIPEIAGNLSAHSQGIDRTPKRFWTISPDVLELSFRCNAAAAVIKNVMTPVGPEFGINRGEFLLIDTSRNAFNEPGLYLIGGHDCARRALVERKNDGKLSVRALGDDMLESSPRDSGDNSPVLGRVMGIFKPV